jgi:hypothetical protein
MNKFLRLFIIFGLVVLWTGCKTARLPEKINSVVIYERFVPGGTTIGLMNYLRNGCSCSMVDTTASTTLSIPADSLHMALASAREKRHFQQKIAGITFGGKFYSMGTTHYFAYLEEPKIVIDFTDMKTYILKNILSYDIHSSK